MDSPGTRFTLIGIAALLVAIVALLLLATSVHAGPFQSPSGNIGCYIEKQSARCDIREKDWKAPPKPKSCELDWGAGVAVGPRGKGGIVCAGDTTLGQGRRLGYGKSIEKGAIRCTSRRSGVRCLNRDSGHGFTISTQGYGLF